MRILSLTASAGAFQTLVPVLLHYYGKGNYHGLSVISGEEWDLQIGPFPQRYFEEYSLDPPGQEEWILAAARRALLEERPDLLLTANQEEFWRQLEPLLEELGIRWVTCQTGQASLDWPDVSAAPPTPSRIPRLDQVIADHDPLHGCLCRAENPAEVLRALLEQNRPLHWLEPVNLAFEGSRQRLAYGSYDNEFALAKPSCDLAELLGESLGRGQFRVSLEGRRPGTAGSGPFLEANDRRYPHFSIEIDSNGLPSQDWTAPYRRGAEAELKLLFIDYHNVAGTGQNHASAVNRFTRSTASCLCHAPHPFIAAPSADCQVHFTSGGWTEEHKRLVEQADALIFLEEDDVDTLDWPQPIREIARAKPAIYFYVGQRVHRDVAARQRPGKTVLTALPHVLRMYPNSRFYAGFFPPVLETLKLRPPLSKTDGQIRVLHTPSLPHPRLHRFLYHKDSDAFLDAAQVLKARHPNVRFLQLAGVPNQKVLQARLDCDVAFHQLRGFMGLSGGEAMFLERPTIQAFDQENTNRHLEYWGLDCQFPWLNACTATLAGVLESLIVDPQLRQSLGEKSRQFMLDYFRPEVGIRPFMNHCLDAVETHQ